LYGMTTAQVYAEWARKSGVEVLTDDLPEGARLHWIGPRSEERVILYFHGASSVLQVQVRCVDRKGRGFVQAEVMFFL